MVLPAPHIGSAARIVFGSGVLRDYQGFAKQAAEQTNDFSPIRPDESLSVGAGTEGTHAIKGRFAPTDRPCNKPVR
jgi:hypothetical protein